MGRKGRECIQVYVVCFYCHFCWQCVCVVCAREKEGRLKDLCLLFYELGLYVGFL